MKAKRPDEKEENPVEIRQIVEVVAREYRLPPERVLGPQRDRAFVDARHLAMYICRELTQFSYPKIARAFDRDHTSVMHGVRRVGMTITIDATYGEWVRKVMQKVRDMIEKK